MRRTSLTALVALALVLGMLPTAARADRRIFAFTYPYMTLPAGGFEIEHYLDADMALRDDPGTEEVDEQLTPDWEHQLEMEYGITDHLDFGFYTVFRQRPYESLTFRGVKLRSRYRLFEQGEQLVDPALYLEAVYKADEIELEQRLILGRLFDRVELDFNLKLEEEWHLEPGGAEFELKLVPSLGVGYHFDEHLALGVEYLGELEWEADEFGHHHYLGPTISIAGTHFWWTVSVAPELTALDAQPAFLVRSLFAVVF